MPNNRSHSPLTYTLFLLTSALLFVGSLIIPGINAEDDEDRDDFNVNLDQEVKQKQKCKIGVFGDPQDSVSSTVSGLCNQQGQNNVDSDSSLGGIGISMGP